ncbi:acyl-CoA Delta(11) desaturase [Hermetia illucens]|nr:acyl-CoA Delta(11) desaturase [Hermetia illucens]
MTADEKDKTASSLNQSLSKDAQGKKEVSSKRESSWPSVLFYIHLYILGLYGVIVLFTNTSLLTIIFTFVLIFAGIIGTTAGSHRLWAHRTYKANASLRFILMLCQTLTGQGSIYNWVQLHRLHHATHKTQDDPYYSDKDFFSAHVLAQMQSLGDKQQQMLKMVDMKDLEEDRIVMFQKRFYWVLYIIVFALLPINAPLEYWGDSAAAAIFVTFSLRYLIVLNVCWLINSAHFIWGLDKNNKPSDSNMIFLVTKTYWPHYHYLLPWDYQTGEFGDYGEDITTTTIRVCAALGWASDLQMVTSEAVKKGLTMAVDTDRPIVDCIKLAAQQELECIPKDHYLQKSKYL